MVLRGEGVVEMSAYEIRTAIQIAAPPEAVWAVLSDVAGWGDWNPYIVRIEGAPVVGRVLHVSVKMPDGTDAEFDADIDIVRPNQRLSWKGGENRSELQGEHIFEIEPASDGGATFIHREIFTGTLAEEKYNDDHEIMTEAFHLMNQGLKRHVEG